jgi:hypothetical protein
VVFQHKLEATYAARERGTRFTLCMSRQLNVWLVVESTSTSEYANAAQKSIENHHCWVISRCLPALTIGTRTDSMLGCIISGFRRPATARRDSIAFSANQVSLSAESVDCWSAQPVRDRWRALYAAYRHSMASNRNESRC